MFDPDSAEQEFETWRKSKRRRLQLDRERFYFENAWAKVAWLAEKRALEMGIELNKLQQRICRQRKANRKLQERIKQLEAQLDTQV